MCVFTTPTCRYNCTRITHICIMYTHDIYTCIYRGVHIYIYIHACICIYICIYIYIYFTYILKLYMYCICMLSHACMYTHANKLCVYVYIYMCTHICFIRSVCLYLWVGASTLSYLLFLHLYACIPPPGPGTYRVLFVYRMRPYSQMLPGEE